METTRTVKCFWNHLPVLHAPKFLEVCSDYMFYSRSSRHDITALLLISQRSRNFDIYEVIDQIWSLKSKQSRRTRQAANNSVQLHSRDAIHQMNRMIRSKRWSWKYSSPLLRVPVIIDWKMGGWTMRMDVTYGIKDLQVDCEYNGKLTCSTYVSQYAFCPFCHIVKSHMTCTASKIELKCGYSNFSYTLHSVYIDVIIAPSCHICMIY